MTPEASGPAGSPRVWSRARWITLVLLVFLAHIGFIFAFGNYKQPPPRVAKPAEVLDLTSSESDELLMLDDPTLFALPNPDGAASQAWLKMPEIVFAPYRWTEPPRLLQLRPSYIGNSGRFVSTNAFAALKFSEKPQPAALEMDSLVIIMPAVTNSTFRITGELAQRSWLNAPVLPSWTNFDLLTNTVVQVLVKPDGSVFSATLLVPPGPGTNEQHAAEFALALIRNARFEEVRKPEMMLGNLIFEWHVLPPP